MTSWAFLSPSTEELDAILALYACTLSVSGAQFVVTHVSGRSERVGLLNEAVDAALRLARAG